MSRAALLSVTVAALLLTAGCGDDGGDGGGAAPPATGGGATPTPGPPPAPGEPPQLRQVILSGPWSGPADAHVEVDGTDAERVDERTWRGSVAMGAEGGSITVRVLGADGATLATRVVTIAPGPTAVACR